MINMNLLTILFLTTCQYCQANLEGPFLFFGPKYLEKYQRPALRSLDQDDLTKIYETAAAIVVFNNQNSVPLSSASFPRLRKQLEGQTTLVLPQDFLDVHPDYVSNETQVRWLLLYFFIRRLFYLYLSIYVIRIFFYKTFNIDKMICKQ